MRQKIVEKCEPKELVEVGLYRTFNWSCTVSTFEEGTVVATGSSGTTPVDRDEGSNVQYGDV